MFMVPGKQVGSRLQIWLNFLNVGPLGDVLGGHMR